MNKKNVLELVAVGQRWALLQLLVTVSNRESVRWAPDHVIIVTANQSNRMIGKPRKCLQLKNPLKNYQELEVSG